MEGRRRGVPWLTLTDLVASDRQLAERGDVMGALLGWQVGWTHAIYTDSLGGYVHT